jgi:hypothetical protein
MHLCSQSCRRRHRACQFQTVRTLTPSFKSRCAKTSDRFRTYARIIPSLFEVRLWTFLTLSCLAVHAPFLSVSQTFCAKFASILQRRHARVQSTVLARRAEGYREMVDKIRHRKLHSHSHSHHSGHSLDQQLQQSTQSDIPPVTHCGCDGQPGHTRSKSSTLHSDRTHSHDNDNGDWLREKGVRQAPVNHSSSSSVAQKQREEHKEAEQPE